MGYKSSRVHCSDEEVDKLVLSEYKGSYKDLEFNSKILGVTKNKNKRVDSVFMECFCGKKYRMIYATFNRNCKEGKDLDCGCIDEKRKELEIQKAVEFYDFKQTKSEKNPHYCKYCESYRESISKSGMSYYCDNCKFLLRMRVKLGKSFEEIMSDWDSREGEEAYKHLPVLKGNVNKGYEVISKTSIDSEFYEELSKCLWISDNNGYVQTSMSKENLRRIGKEHICYTEGISQVKLHRVILGINNLSHKGIVGDHINGDKKDNRLCNLRKATHEENSRNNKKYKNGTYEYIGIFEDKSRPDHIKRWRARVDIGKKSLVEFFHTELEAAKGYDHLLREYRLSEFNVYNFPEVGERGRDGNIRIT